MPDIRSLSWVFARYSNFTLGGGSATTAVLHHELVHRRGWLTNDSFALCFALGRLTPGTNLLAFCTGVGWLLRGMARCAHGMSGAVVALFAASIPCTIFVVLLTALFSRWQENQLAQSAIHGAIAVAVAITVKTVWTIAKPHFKGRERIRVIAHRRRRRIRFQVFIFRHRRLSGCDCCGGSRGRHSDEPAPHGERAQHQGRIVAGILWPSHRARRRDRGVVRRWDGGRNSEFLRPPRQPDRGHRIGSR